MDAGIKIRLCHDRIRFKDFLFLKPLVTVKHARANISNINALIKIPHKANCSGRYSVESNILAVSNEFSFRTFMVTVFYKMLPNRYFISVFAFDDIITGYAEIVHISEVVK